MLATTEKIWKISGSAEKEHMENFLEADSQQRQYLPPDADPFFAVPADTYRGHPIMRRGGMDYGVLRFRVHLDQQSIYS